MQIQNGAAVGGGVDSDDADQFPPGGIVVPPHLRIYTPSRVDVLFGRGRPFQSHPGNLLMLKTIDDSRERYYKAERREKYLIIEQILESIKERGGRFLMRVDYEHYWYEVNRKIAYKKVGHAFRSKVRVANNNKSSSSVEGKSPAVSSSTAVADCPSGDAAVDQRPLPEQRLASLEQSNTTTAAGGSQQQESQGLSGLERFAGGGFPVVPGAERTTSLAASLGQGPAIGGLFGLPTAASGSVVGNPLLSGLYLPNALSEALLMQQLRASAGIFPTGMDRRSLNNQAFGVLHPGTHAGSLFLPSSNRFLDPRLAELSASAFQQARVAAAQNSQSLTSHPSLNFDNNDAARLRAAASLQHLTNSSAQRAAETLPNTAQVTRAGDLTDSLLGRRTTGNIPPSPDPPQKGLSAKKKDEKDDADHAKSTKKTSGSGKRKEGVALEKKQKTPKTKKGKKSAASQDS